MSRIGRNPIKLPQGVTVTEHGQGGFIVKGPKGELRVLPVPDIEVSRTNGEISFKPLRESKKAGALWGLARALFANAVEGVSRGFEKKLQIEGIGYRGEVRGREIIFNLGFSHQIMFPIPEGIEVTFEKNIITVSGADKALVGETAAKIRSLKKPEPYKGKGIRYSDEVIKIKAGKKAVSTTG